MAGRTKRGGHGTDPGQECGVVRGSSPPCPEILNPRGECRLHCRFPTRNAESVSVLCPQWRMRGAPRCRRHGGRARKGALHPGQTAGGRWSRYAPQRYAGLVSAVSAGDPLDLHDDIHLVSARIAELLAAIDAEGSPDFVRRVRRLIGELRRELAPVLTNASMDVMSRIEAALESAARDFSLWGEVSDLFGQRVKMVESQRKRDLEGGKYVTADDMIAMVNAMGMALKRKLEARLPKEEADALLTDIGAEFAAIQGVGRDPGIIDGGEA